MPKKQYLCAMDSLELHIIAHAHNGFTDKFGIPRQPQSLSHIETRIVFTPPFRVREALRGIEGFSHLWLIWGFSENANLPSDSTVKGEKVQWSPTVRPPRLGGNKRMGVFATRSPFRPNPIGLSSVRLLRIEETEKAGIILVVAGAVMLDGTPIYDIKPYLSYSDAHPGAHNGFAENTKDYHLPVIWEIGVAEALPEKDRLAIQEILTHDPRPAYQHDPDRIYKMDFDGYQLQFVVQNNLLRVIKAKK